MNFQYFKIMNRIIQVKNCLYFHEYFLINLLLDSISYYYFPNSQMIF